MKKNTLKHIVLSSSCNDLLLQDCMEKIAEKTRTEAIIVHENIIGNIDSLKEALDADAVVFFERIDKSKYADIDKEICLCRNNGIRILGFVVIAGG